MSKPRRGEAASLRDSAFGFPLTPVVGRREETLLCKIPSLWLYCVVTCCPRHSAKSPGLCLSTRVHPEFLVSSGRESNVSTWATADPERASPPPLLPGVLATAFPRPRLAPAAPRPAGSRSLRAPGKGHSSGSATRDLLGRQQPILTRHTRAPANQRPSYSWVQPAPAFSACSPSRCR